MGDVRRGGLPALKFCVSAHGQKSERGRKECTQYQSRGQRLPFMEKIELGMK